MKKMMLLSCVSIAMICSLEAATVKINGYWWTYRVENASAQIISSDSWSTAISPNPNGAITIPSTLGGYTVTSIGAHALYGCRGLTSVTIPDSVTNIGDYAFSGCGGLTSVTIPDSVTNIGDYAFEGCSGLTNVTIPDSVTDIGDYAFWGCSGLTSVAIPDNVASIGRGTFSWCSDLTSVTIPNSVINIGDYAFEGCSGLASVTMPNSVTKIGDHAFYDCSGLTSVTIPDSVTNIGYYAFKGCSGLTNILVGTDNTSYMSVNGSLLTKDGKTFLQGINGDVTIPDGVTNIGYYAFWGCSGLTSVTIPDSVTSIGHGTFSYCSGLTNIFVGINNTSYMSVNGLLLTKDGKTFLRGLNGNVTIPASVTSIGTSAFSGCSGLTSVTIPNSVTNIGESAFSGCSGLTSVTIPDSVTNIGESAFWYCDGLTSMTIPNSVENIGYSAFYGCSGLTSVTIPNSVTNIGSYAFNGCSSLEAIYISDLATWCGIAHVYGENLHWAQPNIYIDGSLITNMTNVTIPDSVTRIDSYAFYGCSGLTNVTIPDSVTSIAYNAFSGCSNLTSVSISISQYICSSKLSTVFPDTYAIIKDVTILDGVTNIGYSVFSGCRGLTSVSIPNGVTDIGYDAFYGCGGLTSVTIPDSVTSIGSSAFYGCSGLTSVTIPNSVTNIGYSAFYGCSGLISVTIPNSVTNIGHSAFYGCSSLTSVTIPDSVTWIGNNAFYDTPFYNSLPNGLVVLGRVAYAMKGNCPANVMIPASVTSIGDRAFYGCSGLTSVTIPASVMSIGYYAFYGCGGLRSVHISDLAAWCTISFGPYAYYGTYSNPLYCAHNLYLNGSLITDMTIPTGVTEIEACAFSGLSGLTSVTIPASVTNIGDYAFYDCNGLTNVFLSSDFEGSTGIFPASATIVRYIPLQTVTLDANGGAVSNETIQVKYGSTYGMLPVPCRVGYSFGEWMLNDSPVSSNTVVSMLDDHTLVAQWIADKYRVTFDANGGTGGTSENLDYESVLVVPTVVRTGYTLNGWTPNVPETVPLGGATYTAQWKINQYTVTFNASGGNGGTSGKQDYGSPIVAPTVTRTGYTFKGWSPAVATTVPAEDVTYTAQWEINRYAVTFDANGGECGTETVSVEYNSAIGTLPVPTRTKAVFIGWFTEAEGGDKVDASLMVMGATTLYARWLTEVSNPVIATNGKTMFRTDSCVVTITCATEGVVVYYTDDGTTPKKTESYRYRGPFSITETTTFKAIAVIGDIQSEYVTVTITKQLTLEEALDVGENVTVTTSTPLPWKPILDPMAKVGDATARSGAIGNRTNTWLSATVEGAGTMTFWCKVSCEHDEDNTFTWDRLMVYTNNVEIEEWRMDGETGWTQRELTFAGGENTVKWVYYKDRTGSEGEDCAWVDGVTWTPRGTDVVVDMGGGKSVTVPETWIEGHPALVAAAGGDASTALQATAANGRLSVVECYVLGLDPESTTNDFKITSFPMKADGTPDLENIVFDPPEARWNVSGARPVVKGAASLGGEWQAVTEENKAGFRFFKVEVVLP